MSNKFKKGTPGGTSLLELVVALSIFIVVILSVTSIFQSVVNGQRNSISAQNIQESLRYVMERFSREVRVARISNADCQSFVNPPGNASYKVYNTAAGGEKLYFKTKDEKCISYSLDNGRILVNLEGAGGGGNPAADYITPQEVTVDKLMFYVKDDQIGAFHSQQPQVTILINAFVNGLAQHRQEINLQTTVSSRYYE